MTPPTLWMLAGAAVASVVWVTLLAHEVRGTARVRRELRLTEEALAHTRRALEGARRQASALPSDPAEVRRVVDGLTGAEVWGGPEDDA